MESKGDQTQRDMATARSLWEELAVRARLVHCPDHYTQPWRVLVLGDTPDKLRLSVSGCCARLGDAVNEMIRAEPRISGPR